MLKYQILSSTHRLESVLCPQKLLNISNKVGEVKGIGYAFAKRHSIRSAMIFSVKSSNSMAFSRESFLGLGHTYLTANNSIKVNGVDSDIGK